MTEQKVWLYIHDEMPGRNLDDSTGDHALVEMPDLETALAIRAQRIAEQLGRSERLYKIIVGTEVK